MPAVHIIQLPKNNRGNDYIIGDVHGCNSGLRAVIDDLKIGDRLFLVGDLFDRGPDSIDVFKAITEAIRADKEIYAVRGNHEFMFLEMMSVLERFNNHLLDRISTASKKTADIFLKNGGKWIFSDGNHLNCDEPIDYDRLFTRSLRQEVNDIKLYIDSLPYIILVGDIDDKKNAFIICHAAMPFDDETLKQRLLIANPSLTPIEIHSAIWERPDDPSSSGRFYDSKRTARSLLTYCGHSTLLLEDSSFKIRVVRHETSHVNLDVGSYFNHKRQLFLRMNHTTGNLDQIGKSTYLFGSNLDDVADAITRYIKTFRALNLQRVNLISSLTTELEKHTQPNQPADTALATLQVQLLGNHSRKSNAICLNKEQIIEIELRAMIHQLNCLIESRDKPIHVTWQPSSLVTDMETWCCFFPRASVLNSFYKQVIQLGGRPVDGDVDLALEMI